MKTINHHTIMQISYRSPKFIVVVSASALFLTVFLLTGARMPPAKGLPEQLHINWTPESVVANVIPGESKTIPVSFTVPRTLNDVVVQIPPELVSYVHAEPQRFDRIHQGETVNLNLTVASPIDALPQVVEGSIDLIHEKILNNNTVSKSVLFANSFPVTVNVEWPRFSDSSTEASFSYTTFGATGTVSSDIVDFSEVGTGTIYYVKFPTQSSPTPATQYLVTILPNSQYQSIRDWFVGNVDSGQLLMEGGSFEFRQFTSGIEALLLTGPIPPGYDGGPVSEIFAMSTSKKSVVTITTSNDDTMRRDFKLSSEIIERAYLQILEDIELP